MLNKMNPNTVWEALQLIEIELNCQMKRNS